jgi:hypothetical protein
MSRARSSSNQQEQRTQEENEGEIPKASSVHLGGQADGAGDLEVGSLGALDELGAHCDQQEARVRCASSIKKNSKEKNKNVDARGWLYQGAHNGRTANVVGTKSAGQHDISLPHPIRIRIRSMRILVSWRVRAQAQAHKSSCINAWNSVESLQHARTHARTP